MWIARNFDFAQYLSFTIQFHHLSFPLETDEVVSVAGFARSPKLIVCLRNSGSELDLLRDFSIAPDFDNSAGTTFHHHDPPVGQRLTGMHFDLVRRLIFPNCLFFGCDFESAIDKAKEEIAIWRFPAILRIFAFIFPGDLPFRRDHADFISAIIATKKRVLSLACNNRSKQQGKGLEERFHGFILQKPGRASTPNMSSASPNACSTSYLVEDWPMLRRMLDSMVNGQRGFGLKFLSLYFWPTKVATIRQDRLDSRFASLRWLVLFVLLVTLSWPARGAGGIIYYNRITSVNSPATVRRVGGDGTGDQALALNLPSPVYPTISRDGRHFLVTSPDPGRPFKISNNVFIGDLFTGALGRATSYEDEVVLDGALFARDLGELAGKPNVSSYKVNFPYHKAFSPDGSRVVVMNLFKSGSVTGGTPFNPGDSTISSGRFPVVDVYRVADALPDGPYVFLAAQERDGFNQGGDGVDWHPALNEVVAAVAADIPATGPGGRTSMEGTVLAVFSSTGISPFIRKLTSPVGREPTVFLISPP